MVSLCHCIGCVVVDDDDVVVVAIVIDDNVVDDDNRDDDDDNGGVFTRMCSVRLGMPFSLDPRVVHNFRFTHTVNNVVFH